MSIGKEENRVEEEVQLEAVEEETTDLIPESVQLTNNQQDAEPQNKNLADEEKNNKEAKKQEKENKKEIKKKQKKNMAYIDKEIKKVNGKIDASLSRGIKLGNDGELNTAFFVIFSDVFSILKNEIEKIKRRVNEEKLEILEAIKEEYEKTGELTKEMLEKTTLLDEEKEKLLEMAKEIKDGIADNGEYKDNFNVNGLISKVKQTAETSKKFSVSDVLAGNIINTIENVASNKDKDENKDEEKDRDTLKNQDRLRDKQKVRLR